MKKIIFLFVVILFMTRSSAYTTIGGLEMGDQAYVYYRLTYDGEVQEESAPEGFLATVGTNLIEGFSEGLVGMIVGEEKDITVSPNKGYTNPSHSLYGKTLYFKLRIIDLVCCDTGFSVVPTTTTTEKTTSVSTNNAPTESIFDNMIKSPIVKMVGIIIGVIIVYSKFLAPKPQ